MSVKALTWAWGLAERLSVDEFPKGPSDVLVALADFAGDDGTCWPSQETVGARCRYKERATRDHLAWLEDHGLISRSARWVVGKDRRKHRTSDMIVLAVGKTRPDVSPSESIPAESAGMNVMLFGPLPDESFSPSESIPAESAGMKSGGSGEAAEVSSDAGIYEGTEPPSKYPGQGACAREAGPGRAGDAPLEDSELASVGSVSGSGCVEPSREDRELLESCLPAGWAWRLDGVGVAKVLPLVRERLAVSWTPGTLRAGLEATAPPASVRNWSGLIAARLKAMPVDDGPRRVQAAPVEDWRSGETDAQRAARVAARQARLEAEPWWPDWAAALDRGAVKRFQMGEFVADWYREHPESARAPKQAWVDATRVREGVAV